MGNNKSIFTTISSLLEEKINDKEYINRSKKRETDFSRNRKLSFADYMVLLLKRSKKGLQPALNEFCRETKTFATEYSKQAFSKGRERIRPEAIQELFEDTVAGFYSTATYKTLKGYRVSAIDGTDYNLPYTDQLMEKFGSEKFAHNLVQVQALGSFLLCRGGQVFDRDALAAFKCDLALAVPIGELQATDEAVVDDHPLSAVLTRALNLVNLDFVDQLAQDEAMRYRRGFLIFL